MSEPQRPGASPSHPTFDTEIDSRAIGLFGVYLAIGVLVVAILMWALFRDFKKREEAADQPASPLVDRTQRHLPPEPRLQTTPELDLQAYLAEQRRRASTYGWVDEKLGLVHIPVDEAMDVLSRRGLPVRPAPGSTPPAEAAPVSGDVPAAAAPGAARATGGRPPRSRGGRR